MKQVLAIAMLAARAAVRLRLVASLLGLVLLAVIALPVSVRGDGTLTGRVQITLHYSLWSAFFLISAAVAWAGCMSAGAEIRDRHAYLLVTKPVRPAQIWLGKWLGITALGVSLTIAAAAAVYLLVMWTVNRPGITPAAESRLRETVFRVRRTIRPAPAAADELTPERVRDFLAGRDLPEGASARAAATVLRARWRLTRNTVPPGIARRWVFRLPRRPAPDAELELRFSFVSSRHARNQRLTGQWLAGPPGAADRYRHIEGFLPRAVHRVAIPGSAVDAAQTLTVDFINSETRFPATVVFAGDPPVTLLIPAGRFTPNFARAVAVAACRVAFVAALGTTAGCMFSLPVGAVTVYFLMILFSLGGYVRAVASGELPVIRPDSVPVVGPAIDFAVRAGFRLLSLGLTPVRDLDAVSALPSGILVPWSAVITAGLAFGAAYTGVAAAIGILALSRRQFGAA